MFFWFFPARVKAADAPLLLWLEGGPGWPTMYAVFKENGPFLVGWDSVFSKTYLLPNQVGSLFSPKGSSVFNMCLFENP